MIVGSFVSLRCARYLVKDDRIYPFAIAVVVGGLVAARIAHVSDNWNVYAGRPFELVAFWNGGIATTGAPIGSSIAGYVMARRLRLPLGFMFDISVIGIALGEAVGRFFLGFLRVGAPTYAFGLGGDQTIAVLVFAAAITVLAGLLTRARVTKPMPIAA